MTAIPALERLRQTLAQSLPYCGGTTELPPGSLDLYYGKESAKFLDLSNTTISGNALDILQSACEPAPFGRNAETILDETYRKAGKMDTSEFMIRLDVVQSGLLDVVCSSLLSGDKSRRGVTAELYKLNVYGEGAFFKSHIDTPTSGSMFGSLVVVFPTPHTGGTLVLRHHQHEWTFDSAKLLADTPSRVAYAAFFSDVEHEVTPVTSGHRITVTYNLYWADSKTDREITGTQLDGVSILQPPSASVSSVGCVLSEVLQDKALLPAGGTLGFGLRHAYPFPRTWDPEVDKEDPLECLPAVLKGSDLALFDACEGLGLKPKLKFISKENEFIGEDHLILLDRAIQISDTEVHDALEQMLEHHGGFVMEKVDPDDDSGMFKGAKGAEQWVAVHWVTKVGRMNTLASPFISYGPAGDRQASEE